MPLPTALPPDQRLPGIAAADVVWETPSQDALGSMPLGNGDLAINAWVEADGDLHFYLGKTDAWDEHGRLLKIGRVRVALTPNPFRTGGTFRQVLQVQHGTMTVTAQAPGEAPVEIRLWVDAHHPVIEVAVTSATPVAATVSFHTWRTVPMTLPSIECSDIFNRHPQGQPTVVAPDTILTDLTEDIGWCHRNERSIGPELTMAHQDLREAPWTDPLLHRVTGAVIRAPGAKRVDDQHLALAPARQLRLGVYALSLQPATIPAWQEALHVRIAAIEAQDPLAREQAHRAWWTDFWSRSSITIRDRAANLDTPTTVPELLVGCGPRGCNATPMTIGRLSLFDRILSAESVAALAADDHGPLPETSGALATLRVDDASAPRALEPSAATLPQAPWTVEMWVRTAMRDDGAYILHQRTPDGSDGVVLDTMPNLFSAPGARLRCTIGDRVWTTGQVLGPDAWHHLAFRYDGQTVGIALDGQDLPVEGVTGDQPGAEVGQAYTLQRFVTACAGRGAYPIKFNGSLFTVGWKDCPGDADYRRWGPGYWWQNTRLPYLAACTAGDTDLTDPLFRLYGGEVLAVCRYRTQRYFGIDGAYVPECMYPWGAVFMESYGWEVPAAERQDKLQISGYHKREWVAGLELAFMMLDRYEHTLDQEFLTTQVLPTARAVLAFFAHFYPVGANGRLDMQPAQALEMWWDVVDPAPEIAGLQAVTERLLALPENLLPAADRAWLMAFQPQIPDLPQREEAGLPMLAAARIIRSPKKNFEAPELYAVFPFRRVALETPDVALGVAALEHRLDRGCFGWRQDDLYMACLGQTRQARAGLVARTRQRSACRFPGFWGPNYDWTPDQDHGGVLMKTVQALLMQTSGRKILLLPAWPAEWDADFTLHAPGRTVVSGSVRGGRLTALQVTPPERLADVVVIGAP